MRGIHIRDRGRTVPSILGCDRPRLCDLPPCLEPQIIMPRGSLSYHDRNVTRVREITYCLYNECSRVIEMALRCTVLIFKHMSSFVISSLLRLRTAITSHISDGISCVPLPIFGILCIQLDLDISAPASSITTWI